MVGLGHWWIIFLVLLIVLIVYGPGRLPDVGSAVGRAFREFRKAAADLQDGADLGISEPDLPRHTEEQQAPGTR